MQEKDTAVSALLATMLCFMIFIASVHMCSCVEEVASSRQFRRRTEPYTKRWLEAKTLSHS